MGAHVVRHDDGPPSGPMVGIGYTVLTTDLPLGWRRVTHAYDCGCRFASEIHCEPDGRVSVRIVAGSYHVCGQHLKVGLP